MSQFRAGDKVIVKFKRACPVRGTVVALRPGEIKVKSAGQQFGEWFAESLAELIERTWTREETTDVFGNMLDY